MTPTELTALLDRIASGMTTVDDARILALQLRWGYGYWDEYDTWVAGGPSWGHDKLADACKAWLKSNSIEPTVVIECF